MPVIEAPYTCGRKVPLTHTEQVVEAVSDVSQHLRSQDRRASRHRPVDANRVLDSYGVLLFQGPAAPCAAASGPRK